MANIASAKAETTLLILGDSLSASYQMQQNQGWVSLLQQRYQQRNQAITIINASISGETTAGGLARLDKLLESKKPDLLLIELGGNDGLRGFPVDKTQQNLLQIITKAKANNIRPAIMQIRIPPNFGPRYTKKFEAVFVDLAKQQAIPLIPFFMEEIAIKPELVMADGLHPNQKAMPIITEYMDKALAKWLEKH